MHWIKISCILCIFGCFKDFRPSESFITNYLTGPWKNFTTQVVNRDIYPVRTYSNAATLIVVFLITDFVRYKPIIILCGLSGVITFLLIILGRTILVMQIAEFSYGLFQSTEVAYYIYIYAKMDKSHYQKMASYIKAASLFGYSMSGVVAQLTASFNLLDYYQLNYLTLSAFTIATIWAFFLPSTDQSIYFHRVDAYDVENLVAEQKKTEASQSEQRYVSKSLYRCGSDSRHDCMKNDDRRLLQKIAQACVLLWKHFVEAHTNYRGLKWLVWTALSTSGYLQVISYIQLLWKDSVESNDKIYNGAVNFTYAIIGAVAVFCVGKIRFNWPLLGEITLSVFALLAGSVLLVSSYIYNIWLLYAGYIIFGVIYHTMIVAGSFEAAKHISENSYGLIFGINIFFSLVIQTLLSLIVLNIFMLHIRWQFYVYGCYFIVLAAIYVVMGVINLVQHYRSGEDFHIWISNDDNFSPGMTHNANGVINTAESLESKDTVDPSKKTVDINASVSTACN